MLTSKQHDLLLYIHQTIQKTGVSPSFDEMKDALKLKSKSGIHRLISALEERGFIRRLPNRARALEILKLPEQIHSKQEGATNRQTGKFTPAVIEGGTAANPEAQSKIQRDSQRPSVDMTEISVLGRIAAGTPISAIQHEQDRFSIPSSMLRSGEHFALKVQGESMINEGILDGDLVIIQRCADAANGEIVVALVDDEEATLKILHKKGNSIALEAANPAFETRIFGPNRIKVQGRLIGLIRHY